MRSPNIPPLRTAWVISLLTFIPLLLVDKHYQLIHHLIRAVGFSIAAGMVVAYAPAFWKLLWAKRMTRGEGLAFGIFVFWLGIVGHVLMNMIAQFSADPPAVVHSIYATASLWLALSGALVMFMSSEGADHITRARDAWVVGLWVALAIFLATMAAFYLNVHQWWNDLPYWLDGHEKWML